MSRNGKYQYKNKIIKQLHLNKEKQKVSKNAVEKTYNTDRDTIYLDAGETTSKIMSISGWRLFSDLSYRIYVEIDRIGKGNVHYKTDSYEKLLTFYEGD